MSSVACAMSFSQAIALQNRAENTTSSPNKKPTGQLLSGGGLEPTV
jgi:hypothetical protein